jgi:hypothetical protein
MATFDYKRAKQEIAEINAIVETCPESVREKCFELLFHAVFNTRPPARTSREEPAHTPPPKPDKPAEDHPADPTRKGRKLPPNVLAFARRHNITLEDLEKLFILDHEPLLPVYKIPHGKIVQAQLYKVMMILLENGLLNNQISAPYPELRESVKEDGLLDGNFNMNLKRHHSLFKGAITKDEIKQEDVVELTGAGMERLAEIVKELGQP